MLERVLRLIVEERVKCEQSIVRGQCDDWSAYRERCGRIAAFMVAEEIVREQIARDHERNEE